MVLGYNVSGPMGESAFGLVPAGLLATYNNGNGRQIFTLCGDCEGDIVTQQWSAWVIGSTVIPTPTPGQTFVADGTWLCPAGVTSIGVECYGASGGADAASVMNGPSHGGGGGAYSAIAAFTVTPGHTYTVKCFPGGAWSGTPAIQDTWFSFTAIAPANTTDGVLGTSGEHGKIPGLPAIAAPGGKAAASIGTVKFSGGDGGLAAAFVPIMGGSGPGGGGRASSAGAGTSGVGGTSGLSPGGVGGAVGGGNGGASDASASVNGVAGTDGAAGGSAVSSMGVAGGLVAATSGKVVLTYGSASQNVITVIESFDVPALSQPASYNNVYAPVPPTIPPMSDAAMQAFKAFMTKVCKGE